jgi:hypothetical protein
MKVARWKVVGLVGALALGYVASADAAQIKVDENTWADFGLQMKIWYKNLDKRSHADWTKNVFDVGQTKIYFTGQVIPAFQFYVELDTNGATGTTTNGEAGINLAFAKEFQVLAGKIRKPFTRAQLSSSYALLTPQGYWLDPQTTLGPIKAALGDKDGGLMVHGDLAGGMFRYRVGVYNENRELGNKLWVGTYNSTHTFGWFGVGKQRVFYLNSSNFVDFDYKQTPGTKANDLKNFEWNARIEFTPTMLGFKPESAATITAKYGDTYLGSKDVFTIGLGYHAETHTPKATVVASGVIGGIPSSRTHELGDLKRKGWTVDALFEKKFGNVVPNLQIGYISLDKTHYYTDYWNAEFKKGDSDIWYITGQLLFDQVMWLGKPAIAFRYEKIKGDGQFYYYDKNTDTEIIKKDLTAETFGLAFNYYIKGQAARISLGFDHTKYDDALKRYLKAGNKEDSITDWYLYLQSKF